VTEEPIQQAFFDDGHSDPIFQRALKTGNLAAILTVAVRRALRVIPDDLDHPAIHVLRDACPDPPEDYDPRPYIAANYWVFASTMPENPHYYVMLKASTDWREHLRFLRWIRRGVAEVWRDGRRYPYRYVDGYRYWAMPDPSWTIINRERQP
jgi:hypothetical protein